MHKKNVSADVLTTGGMIVHRYPLTIEIKIMTIDNVSGIIFTRYTHSQKIGNTNDLSLRDQREG